MTNSNELHSFLADRAAAHQANLTSGRIRLAEAASNGSSATDVLVDLVNALAEAEGAQAMYASAIGLLERGMVSDGEVAGILAQQLHMDDAWSGRTNDARRCQFSGRLEAVKAIAEFVRYLTAVAL